MTLAWLSSHTFWEPLFQLLQGRCTLADPKFSYYSDFLIVCIIEVKWTSKLEFWWNVSVCGICCVCVWICLVNHCNEVFIFNFKFCAKVSVSGLLFFSALLTVLAFRWLHISHTWLCFSVLLSPHHNTSCFTGKLSHKLSLSEPCWFIVGTGQNWPEAEIDVLLSLVRHSLWRISFEVLIRQDKSTHYGGTFYPVYHCLHPEYGN